MDRRKIISGGIALLTTVVSGGAESATTGVVLIHGKQDSPGGSLSRVASALSGEGLATSLPSMPWSGSNYLSGNWASALALVAASVREVRSQGALKVVLIGHSMGCPAAMSYIGRSGGIAGLVLAATGHVPTVFYSSGVTRESVDRARAMVKAGRGSEVATFSDSNQGRASSVSLAAADYLSYLDPNGPAVMGKLVGSIRCPVLLVAGTGDAGAMQFAQMFGRTLTSRPKGQYVEVSAGHAGTPSAASTEIVAWVKSI